MGNYIFHEKMISSDHCSKMCGYYYEKDTRTHNRMSSHDTSNT